MCTKSAAGGGTSRTYAATLRVHLYIPPRVPEGRQEGSSSIIQRAVSSVNYPTQLCPLYRPPTPVAVPASKRDRRTVKGRFREACFQRGRKITEHSRRRFCHRGQIYFCRTRAGPLHGHAVERAPRADGSGATGEAEIPSGNIVRGALYRA